VNGVPLTDSPGATVPDTELDPIRQRLIECAAAVFAERGYDRAGVQEIARRAGLTTGAIYGRFTGKAELLKAAIEAHTTDELNELFASEDFDGRTTDVLRMIGSHLVTPGRREDHEGALVLEAFAAARRDPDVHRVLNAILQERASRLGQLIEVAKLDGSVDTELDTESLVRFCHAVGLGFCLYEALSVPMPQPPPWEQLIGRLVAALSAPDPQRPERLERSERLEPIDLTHNEE
jgi:AcrR family transcriptional regulator